MPMHCPQCKCLHLLTTCYACWICMLFIYIFSGFAYSRQRVPNSYRNFPFLMLLTYGSRLVALIFRLGNDLVRQTHISSYTRGSDLSTLYPSETWRWCSTQESSSFLCIYRRRVDFFHSEIPRIMGPPVHYLWVTCHTSSLVRYTSFPACWMVKRNCRQTQGGRSYLCFAQPRFEPLCRSIRGRKEGRRFRDTTLGTITHPLYRVHQLALKYMA